MLVARAVRLSAARIQGLPCGCLYVQGLPLYAPSLQSRGLPLPTFAAPHSSAVCPLETPADARGARASPHRLRGLARLAVFRLQLSTAAFLPRSEERRVGKECRSRWSACRVWKYGCGGG